MGAVSSEVGLVGIDQAARQADNAEGLRYARSCFLDELPGAAFGIITLGYLVMSLISLAW
ncbi:MAG TPA: hypothetical protein VEK14_01045 [Rhodomicrobium sp.]|nr:hypothetical protein [Rhodomicrobium sp.]